ncbi:MAG: amidohydrolase [Pedosphaera sp. Tous-C6FEB]|nr:MAG: amidohydrolase [Pedosphaera sp. Tous-C6FEB]
MAAASSLSACSTLPPTSTTKGFIDAHVHVWTPDTNAFPLAPGYQPSAMQPPSFTPEELLSLARPHGVTRVVLIQMSFYRFDNRYMLDAMRRFPGVFAGVGIVDASAARPQDAMRDLARQGVRGFRINPGSQNIDAWLGSPGMTEMWRCAGDYGLAICPLIGPNALPGIAAMCAKFPRTRVVIDHFARIGTGGTFPEAEVSQLCALAKFPLVHVKASAFYAFGQKRAPYLDFGPMIRRLRDTFGPQRIMWATDCPYQVQRGHTYADSVALIRDRLDFLSAIDRDWMLRRTAEKVFFA